MKILYLFHWKKNNNYDHFLHGDFAHYISYYPGIELQGYGLDLHLGYPDLVKTIYNPNILLEDIYKNFDFDVIIANTKGRMFEYYNPHTGIDKGTWLPKDFSKWSKTKKIILEEDAHYEANDKWYQEMGFDLILQRHYSQSLRQQNVPMKFFPFSVDTSIFNPWKFEVIHQTKILPLINHNKRQRKIAFIGNDGDKAYVYRFWAIRNLVQAGIGVNFSIEEPGARRKIDGEYIQILREYIAHISCGSTFEICAAKNLEIISSGAVLFTNKFQGIDLLFPENCYVSYKNDWSDLLDNAKKIINEPEYVKEIVKNGREWVNTHHTHNIRIKELLNIIGDLK